MFLLSHISIINGDNVGTLVPLRGVLIRVMVYPSSLIVASGVASFVLRPHQCYITDVDIPYYSVTLLM